MSNQSGINASEDLKRFLASSRDGSIRGIKVDSMYILLYIAYHQMSKTNFTGDNP